MDKSWLKFLPGKTTSPEKTRVLIKDNATGEQFTVDESEWAQAPPELKAQGTYLGEEGKRISIRDNSTGDIFSVEETEWNQAPLNLKVRGTPLGPWSGGQDMVLGMARDMIANLKDFPRRTASTADYLAQKLPESTAGKVALGILNPGALGLMSLYNPKKPISERGPEELAQTQSDLAASAMDLGSMLGGGLIGKAGQALGKGLLGQTVRAVGADVMASPAFVSRQSAGDPTARGIETGISAAIAAPLPYLVKKAKPVLAGAQEDIAKWFRDWDEVTAKQAPNFAKQANRARKQAEQSTFVKIYGKTLDELPGLTDQMRATANQTLGTLENALDQATRITMEEADLISRTVGTYAKETREAFPKVLTSQERVVGNHELIRSAQLQVAQVAGEITAYAKKIALEGPTDASQEFAETLMKRATEASNRFRALRSEWGREGRALQLATQAVKEMKDIAAQTVHFNLTEGQQTVFQKLAERVKTQGLADGLLNPDTIKDGVRFWTVNIFPMLSFSRDIYTNAIVVGSEVTQGLMADAYDFVIEGSTRAYRTAGIIEAIKKGTTAPQKVMQSLSKTALGERFQPVFGERLDKVLFFPAFLKRSVDTVSKRLGAMSVLSEKAMREADKEGFKGVARTDFINRFVENAPDEVLAEAVNSARRWGWDRALTSLEESVASSPYTRLLFTPFPRWNFQFTRFMAAHSPLDPEFLGKVKAGKATAEDTVKFMTRIMTGIGGVLAVSDLMYDNVDFKTGDYVNERAERTKLTGLTPLPDLLFLAAWFKGDAANAFNMIQESSFVGLGGGQGIVSKLIPALAADPSSGFINWKVMKDEFAGMLNDLIPGKGVLQAMEQVIDPTERRGFFADVPGFSSLDKLAPPKIDITTGEEKRYLARIPVIDKPMSHVVRGVVGAGRITNPVEAEMMRLEKSVNRARRVSFLEVEELGLGPDWQKKYEENVGKAVFLRLTPMVTSETYKALDKQRRKSIFDTEFGKIREVEKQRIMQQIGIPGPVLKDAIEYIVNSKKVQRR